jgi:phospholipid/cholesterol/gamma-HCH transport system substrate-binding protein
MMMITSFRDRSPRAVAAVSIPVIGALIFLAFSFGTLGLGRGGYSMSGVFAATGGVQVGSEVQLAGVKVGTVTGISPDFTHGNVVISWKVDDGIKLGPQTHADIELANLLGGQYIKLSGPVVRPYADSLSAGGRRIPLPRTSIPYTLNQALNTTTDLAGRLDTQSVDRILKAAAGINPPTQKQLSAMLANLQNLTSTLNRDSPQITAIIANSKGLTAALASKDQQLAQLLTYGESLLNELVKRKAELTAALGKGSQVIRTLDQVVSRHQAQLNTILADFDLASRTLTGGNLPSLNAALAWFGPTFNGLSQIHGPGRFLEGDFIGVGPVQPSLAGPQPNFNPPNYPMVPTGVPNG